MVEALPVSPITSGDLILSFKDTPAFNREVIMTENAPIEYAQGDPHKNSFTLLLEPFPDAGYILCIGNPTKESLDSDTLLIPHHESHLMRVS